MELTYIQVLLRLILLDTVYAYRTSFVLFRNGNQPSSLETHREKREGGGPTPSSRLKLTKFHITSKINNRYARTEMYSYIKNPADIPQEYEYNFKIPVSAFISEFVMKIEDIEYRAQVKAKEEADDIYDKAVRENKGAGLVSQSKDGLEWDKYSVKTNIQAGNKVEFTLVYEHLLERNVGKCSSQISDVYEHKINVDPGDIVPDMKMQVIIDESLPLDRGKMNVPQMRISKDDNNNNNVFTPRSGIFPDANKEPTNSLATIEYDPSDETKATITFQPDEETQQSAQNKGEGVFVVQYDVDRSVLDNDNDIEVVDGYFIHFFAPQNLEPLSKVAIFVLDLSGSMVIGHWSCTDKLKQVKDAMFILLEDDTWTNDDYFNIVTFADKAQPWKSKPILATKSSRQEAIRFINGLTGDGETNLNEAILMGLQQAESHIEAQRTSGQPDSSLETPIIFFMTDGIPTAGITDNASIRSNLKSRNGNLNANVYGLAFGTLCQGMTSPDYEFIKKISEDHGSFARRIYDRSDAALQMECFLSEISTILVKDLTITYNQDIVQDTQSLQSKTFLKGSEQIVVGKLRDGATGGGVEVEVFGQQSDGRGGTEEYYDEEFYPNLAQTSRKPLTFLPRMYAFLTINKLIKNNDPESNKKATNLAIESNFVTALTSLVVTSPVQDVVSTNEDFVLNEAPLVQPRTQPRLSCPCEGSITLYSSTYFRGENWAIGHQIGQLNFDRFDNKMVSVKVEGNCQWDVFTEKDLYGESMRFSQGYYGSIQDVGVLFRDGSSAKRIDNCNY